MYIYIYIYDTYIDMYIHMHRQIKAYRYSQPDKLTWESAHHDGLSRSTRTKQTMSQIAR